jgi:hypothetical protein
MKAVIHSTTASLSSLAPLLQSRRICSKERNTVSVQPANESAQLTTSRRAALALLLFPSLAFSGSADAFSFGICMTLIHVSVLIHFFFIALRSSTVYEQANFGLI